MKGCSSSCQPSHHLSHITHHTCHSFTHCLNERHTPSQGNPKQSWRIEYYAAVTYHYGPLFIKIMSGTRPLCEGQEEYMVSCRGNIIVVFGLYEGLNITKACTLLSCNNLSASRMVAIHKPSSLKCNLTTPLMLLVLA
uniref:Uncharacterized protein n=1 Tax=Chlamydomonas leiostraca TaxID=1034604 RepID=A0A6T8Q8M2_9CHLO|mmetsp:Transcript_16613/g.41527  ORF Transcript_16613/g.41527 Transcript_16613/m.41527 type:complete len:138 (+) Transcript_16613:29-442(+)